jgi:hypothetical protein
MIVLIRLGFEVEGSDNEVYKRGGWDVECVVLVVL